MIRNFIIVFNFFVLWSCTNGIKEQTVAVTSTFDTVAIESVLTDTVTKKDTIVDGGDDQSGNEMQLYHIVCVEESDDYAALHATGLKVSKFLGFKFATLERYYNTSKKRVVLPNDHPDDIYAGEYFFRRYGDDFVSIEMRNAYPDPSLKEDGSTFFFSDTTKMFVFAAMYGEKKQADSLANILKKQFRSTKVIASEIYMGCMH